MHVPALCVTMKRQRDQPALLSAGTALTVPQQHNAMPAHGGRLMHGRAVWSADQTGADKQICRNDFGEDGVGVCHQPASRVLQTCDKVCEHSRVALLEPALDADSVEGMPTGQGLPAAPWLP